MKPDQHELDRSYLIEIRTMLRADLLQLLLFELEAWRRIAINRELDRREALAREMQ